MTDRLLTPPLAPYHSGPGRAAPPPSRGKWGAFRFALGCLLLLAVLLLPDRPGSATGVLGTAVPLELLAAIGLLLLTQGRLFDLLLAAICIGAGVLLFLKLADLGTFTAFGRPFNPLLDIIILTDGWNLLTGSVGLTEALLIILVGLAAWIGTMILAAFLLRGARKLHGPVARTVGASALGLILLHAILVGANGRFGLPPTPFAAANANYLLDRVALMRRSMADLVAFEAELEADPLEARPVDDLLSALEGRDVYLLFVESYGRTVLSNPAYRSLIGPRLESMAESIERAGFTARSGWLTAPTVGGQSWLAHGALASGLPTTDQSRYDRMIASDRTSLNALFREAGWRTVAIMPAITLDWPEGGYYGYDAIYAAKGLGYRGLPFNWVTMPDQYTLSATRRIVEASDRPVMVEAALISSHAPWTPVPSLVPWEEVGDGRIFDEQATSGDPPSVVWADAERVRDHFVRSIDYTLNTVGEFIERFGENAVFIVLGDHQPARIITGDNATRDVPVHVIANDPALLDRLDRMGLGGGLIPSDEFEVRPMWDFREQFVRAMSGPAITPPESGPRPEGGND